MKTKTVELYCDLHPNWHEAPASQCYVSAHTQPYGAKPEGGLRVKITVELPEVPRAVAVDESVKGDAALT